MMALNDSFVRQVKSTGKATGDKYADGGAMYLLVKPAGKYWRMYYTYGGKRKTLALGVYPAVPLAKAARGAMRRGNSSRMAGHGLRLKLKI